MDGWENHVHIVKLAFIATGMELSADLFPTLTTRARVENA